MKVEDKMERNCSCGLCFTAVKKWIGILEYVWACAKCGDVITDERWYQDWR